MIKTEHFAVMPRKKPRKCKKTKKKFWGKIQFAYRYPLAHCRSCDDGFASHCVDYWHRTPGDSCSPCAIGLVVGSEVVVGCLAVADDDVAAAVAGLWAADHCGSVAVDDADEDVAAAVAVGAVADA